MIPIIKFRLTNFGFFWRKLASFSDVPLFYPDEEIGENPQWRQDLHWHRKLMDELNEKANSEELPWRLLASPFFNFCFFLQFSCFLVLAFLKGMLSVTLNGRIGCWRKRS